MLFSLADELNLSQMNVKRKFSIGIDIIDVSEEDGKYMLIHTTE